MSCLFVDQLTVIDCAYLDASRGLVGESWIVDLELEGDLDAQSMVLDFGAVKKRLKRLIDGSVDHSLLVPQRSPALDLHRGDVRSELAFRCESFGVIEHKAPATAVSLLDSEQVNADAVVAYLQPLLAAEVPPNVGAVRLRLRAETHADAYYHYTHGLKKHDGHCQRIAHGHRSRLQICVNGSRDEAIEHRWAERWRDIYLATTEDLLERHAGRLRFGYTSAEGQFELALPESRCDLLTSDTTVECIAEHLARETAQTLPGRRIDVRAYEGVMKGALARIG